MVARLARLQQMATGDVVLRQNAPAKSIFLVFSGALVGRRVDKSGVQDPDSLRLFGPGDFVAVESLFQPDQPQPYTVTVTADAEFLAIDATAFSHARLQIARAQYTRIFSLLSALFSNSPDLDAQEMTRIAGHFNGVTKFALGTVICAEGQRTSGTFYLVNSGRCSVFQAAGENFGNEHQLELRTLGPGTCFGEQAATTQCAHPHSIVASLPVECFTMSFGNFMECFQTKAGLRAGRALLRRNETEPKAGEIRQAFCQDREWLRYRALVRAEADFDAWGRWISQPVPLGRARQDAVPRTAPRPATAVARHVIHATITDASSVRSAPVDSATVALVASSWRDRPNVREEYLTAMRLKALNDGEEADMKVALRPIVHQVQHTASVDDIPPSLVARYDNPRGSPEGRGG